MLKMIRNTIRQEDYLTSLGSWEKKRNRKGRKVDLPPAEASFLYKSCCLWTRQKKNNNTLVDGAKAKGGKTTKRQKGLHTQGDYGVSNNPLSPAELLLSRRLFKLFFISKCLPAAAVLTLVERALLLYTLQLHNTLKQCFRRGKKIPFLSVSAIDSKDLTVRELDRENPRPDVEEVAFQADVHM